MSAWSTMGRHDAVVADAITMTLQRHDLPLVPAEVNYQLLAEANEESLHARYGDDLDEMRAQRLPYLPGGKVHPVAVYSLMRSWIYQSCESSARVNVAMVQMVEMVAALWRSDHGLTDDDEEMRGSEHWAWSLGSEPDTVAWFATAREMAA